MEQTELRRAVLRRGVVRGRVGSLGALLHGWRIDAPGLMRDPVDCEIVVRALRAQIDPFAPDCIIGIERAGTALARQVAASASRDGTLVTGVTYRPGASPRWPDREPWGRTVIVDDVVNTGRTAHAAIREAASVGIVVHAVVCLVRYPRHPPILLRGWTGPVISAVTLQELGLSRWGFGVVGSRSGI